MPLTDIHAVLQAFLDDGWLREPRLVGLDSFDPAELDARGFFRLCDGAGMCLHEETRLMRRANRPLEVLFKLYQQHGQLRANGLELGYQLRLAPFLRAASAHGLPSCRVLLGARGRSGALLFGHGLVLQFAANLRGKPRHFFLTLAEGHPHSIDAVHGGRHGEADLRAASIGHAQALYAEPGSGTWQRKARRGNAALRELAAVLAAPLS